MPLKQKIGLIVWLMILLVVLGLNDSDIIKLVALMGFPLVFMGFGPRIYPKLHLKQKFWFIPLCSSITLPIFFIDRQADLLYFVATWEYWLLAILPPLFSLLFRIKECYQAIKVSILMEPIQTRVFIRRFIQASWLLAAEEILFRALFYDVLSNQGHYIYYFALNAIVFVFYHHFNRFSNYKLKDYVFQALLAIHLSALYIYSDSLIFCIISHFVYNSVYFITMVLNTKILEKMKIKGGSNGRSFVK